MTVRTEPVAFPSLRFFQELQRRMNASEPKYRAIGIMDLALGIRVQADEALKQTRLYILRFDGYACEEAREANAGPEPDLDVIIEGPYGAWSAMFQNIQAHGKADTQHTLNHLTMLDDPLRCVGPDQSRIDKIYRYNYSLQSFFNEAAAIATRFVA